MDLEYPDIGAFDELVNGTDLVGEVKPFGILRKHSGQLRKQYRNSRKPASQNEC